MDVQGDYDFLFKVFHVPADQGVDYLGNGAVYVQNDQKSMKFFVTVFLYPLKVSSSQEGTGINCHRKCGQNLGFWASAKLRFFGPIRTLDIHEMFFL